MLAALGKDDYVVALEITAKTMSTEQLSVWLAERMRDGRPLALLIGGPDGLSPQCRRTRRSELVAVAADPAARTGQGGGCRTDLSCHELACRPSLSPRISRRYPGSMSWISSIWPRGRRAGANCCSKSACRSGWSAATVDEAVLTGETLRAYVARLAAAKADAGWEHNHGSPGAGAGGRHRRGASTAGFSASRSIGPMAKPCCGSYPAAPMRC